MALSLDAVNKKRIQNKKNDNIKKDKVLRPWETFDQLGSQTRTVAAQEAVKKAQMIVERNKSNSRVFSEDCDSTSGIDFNSHMDAKIDEFKKIRKDSCKIKSDTGVVGFFKDMFNQ